MRAMLDPLDPAHLRPLLRACFLKLKQAGVIKDYYYWQKFVIVSIDGVQHFSSAKVRCPHCTTHTHRKGESSYHHAGLAAVLVNPAQPEVFPLDFEPIINLALTPQTLVASPTAPFKSVKEFVVIARDKPGTINYASLGSGSTSHLTSEMFRSAAGIKINFADNPLLSAVRLRMTKANGKAYHK